MTDNITVSDGTVSRTYNKWSGPTVVDKNTREFIRKTDERDATPEILTTRQQLAGVNQRFTGEFAKTKVDATTGKQHTLRHWMGHSGDLVHWTQAEIEAAYLEMAALIAVSGVKADIALGKL